VTAGHFITATATDAGGNTSGFSECRKVVPIDSVDLGVNVLVSANPVPLASNLVYTVTVANAGPTNATGVVVTDRLPAGFTFLSAVSTQGSCSQAAGVVTCNLNTVNRGGLATITITGQPTVFGMASNFVSVAAQQTDHTPENNAMTSLTGAGVADIFVAISDNPDPATAGQPVTYNVTVVNLGPDAAPGVTLVFGLGSEFCPQTAVISQGTFVRQLNTYAVQFGNILKDGTATLTVSGLPTETGTLESHAQALSTVSDLNFNNNFVDASTSVLPGAGVIRFEELNAGTREGTSFGLVTVRRSGGAIGTVTARYAASNGSAVAGQDYQGSTGLLTFTNGETTRVFAVPLINDTDPECNETVMLSLYQATGGAVACIDTNATLTILDNDLELTGELTLVSANTGQPPASGNGFSDAASISSDGRFVAFHSTALDLVPGHTGNDFNVFVRDLSNGSMVRVPNDSLDARQNPVISGSGRHVAFEKDFQDVELFDRQTGSNVVVNVRSDGGQSFGRSFSPSVSSNGTVVSFSSESTDLVPEDGNFVRDIFVRNLTASTTTLVSVNQFGTASGNGYSEQSRISADGRMAAFVSYASDLAAGDTNATGDVFVRDLLAPTNRLVSMNRFGTGSGNGFSYDPHVSADGRYVAFVSHASNLVPNDTNGVTDVFLRDTVAGTTTLVSVNRSGNGSGEGPSFSPSLSAGGRRVAFQSYADDLVLLDTTLANSDVFVRDLNANTTTLVSVNCPGTSGGNEDSYTPFLSGGGSTVFFTSTASDLAGGDFTTSGFGLGQMFRRSLSAAATELVSVDVTLAGGGNGSSFDLAVSFNGSTVAFRSEADNLAPLDNNSTIDIFSWSSSFAPPEPVPTLTITRVTANQATFSWPSPSAGFNLESTGGLNAPIVWSPVNAAVTDNGLIKTVTLQIDPNASTRFFRLRK